MVKKFQSHKNLFFPIYVLEYEKELIFILFKYIAEHQDWLQTQILQLSGVYGSFYHNIWDGGRTLIIDAPYYSEYEVQKFVNELNSNNIIFQFICTNSMLKEEHCFNSYCNMILNSIDNGFGNEIIINSSILEQYIQQTHPNLKLISSITKGHDKNTFVKAMLNSNYDRVMAYPIEDNLQWIKENQYNIDTTKIEIILDNSCANCPISLLHYREESLNNLYNKNTKTIQCPNNLVHDNVILDFDIFNNLNIINYKIVGRTRGFNLQYLINRYVNAIFLPTFHEQAKIEIENLFYRKCNIK